MWLRLHGTPRRFASAYRAYAGAGSTRHLGGPMPWTVLITTLAGCLAAVTDYTNLLGQLWR